MRTIAVIQARLMSARLPGKVLLPIAGKPMLSHVIERTKAIKGVDAVAVTIPDTDPSSAIFDLCGDCYVTTGPEHDVLRRYQIAAEITNADRIVRITSDCPLLDPGVAEAVIALHDENPSAIYASNVYPVRSWPDGLDVEVFTLKAFDVAAKREPFCSATNPREHVTMLMQDGLGDDPCYVGTLSLGRLKWSVDTQEELDFVSRVMSALRPSAYAMSETIEAICRLGLWHAQPESDDWWRAQ